jgi:outer membrane lipoprotein-sorting protein
MSRKPVLAVAGGVLAAALVLASPARAAAVTKPPDPMAAGLNAADRLQALIDRVKFEQGRLTTLEASFAQRRESEMLVAPEESRGTFSFAVPDRVRWEYDSPKPLTLVIRGSEMTTWYRDLGRADRVNVGRYSNQVMRYLGAAGSLETLMQYFTLRVAFPDGKGSAYQLDLAPRYERIAKRLKAMTLWLDPATFLPSRLRYTEADGDVTEYRFTGVRLNAALPPNRFDLTLPAGVEVRTLDLEPGASH